MDAPFGSCSDRGGRNHSLQGSRPMRRSHLGRSKAQWMARALPPVSKRFRCRFPFLPPKSSDPNPMEIAFSKPEAHLRRIGARTFTDMVDALAEIRELYSPQERWNDFKATGYVSSQKPDALETPLNGSETIRLGSSLSRSLARLNAAISRRVHTSRTARKIGVSGRSRPPLDCANSCRRSDFEACGTTAGTPRSTRLNPYFMRLSASHPG